LVLWLMIGAVRAQDFTYTNINGTITITSYTGPGGDVSVPTTINGLPVTTVGDGVEAVFWGTNVTSVNIPNGVTAIRAEAFNGCQTLTNVTLGQNVTSIGNYAFNGCLLPSVEIPDSVTFIAGSAFAGCYSLRAITVGSSNPIYSSLDGVLFDKNQTALLQFPLAKAGSYTIPDGVSIVASNAFAACVGLTTVTIPASVTTIGTAAFEFSRLTSITFPEGITGIGSIGDLTFNSCWLSNVIIPEGVTNIGSSAFSDCNSLTNLWLPDSVTSVGTNAFVDCWALTTVRLGSGLTNIGDGAFGNCPSLVDARIPTNVTTIGAAAFLRCGLTNVTIPNSVTGMGTGAFEQCTNLTNVAIGNGIIQLPEGMFISCTKLASATIGSGVNYIDNGVFQWCTSLKSVYCKSNAPGTYPDPNVQDVFALDNGVNTNVTVYYLPKTTGWHSTFADVPTALWNPQVQPRDASFGVRSNRFGFNVIGTANIPLVIEASTNAAAGSWVCLQSGTLTNGLIYFVDPQWMNYPNRFYRIRSP
jgi:hypothetical protein